MPEDRPLTEEDIGTNITRQGGGVYAEDVPLGILYDVFPETLKVIELRTHSNEFWIVNRDRYIHGVYSVWRRRTKAAIWLPHADVILYRNMRYRLDSPGHYKAVEHK